MIVLRVLGIVLRTVLIIGWPGLSTPVLMQAASETPIEVFTFLYLWYLRMTGSSVCVRIVCVM